MICSSARSPRAFLLRTTILVGSLLVGSAATSASAFTECYIRVCETAPDGTKVCVERPFPCPPANIP